jgi:spore coat polysaccharide biosynthesis predicted glycosyltransferase SpsG
VGAEEIIALVRESEAVVVAASTIALECLCVGAPLLIGTYADNQQRIAKSIAVAGLATHLGDLRTTSFVEFGTAVSILPKKNYVLHQKHLIKSDTVAELKSAFKNYII